ncbi:MAG: LptF/LptG family permease [Candidatus Sericytochromatia bacterium]
MSDPLLEPPVSEEPSFEPPETPSDLKLLLSATWLPSLSLLGCFLLLMLGNTLFIFWELLGSSRQPLKQGLQLLWTNLPAIFVVSGPLLLLWPVVFLLKKWEKIYHFSARRLLALSLTLGLFLSALLLFVQENLVPAANQATVKQLQELMMESRTDDMVFKPQQDIRQMTAAEAWGHLHRPVGPETGAPSPRDWLDFYNKFSLPFAALAFAFWGLLSARFLQRNWRFFWLKLLSMGTFLPVLAWYFVYSGAHVLGSEGRMAPLLAAMIPILSVGGVGLLGFALLSQFSPNSRDLSKT